MPHTVSVCERVRVYEYMSESRDGGEKLKKKGQNSIHFPLEVQEVAWLI